MMIAILEDNEDRRSVMQSVLADRFPMYRIEMFDMASDMIEFLQKHLDSVLVIALDHDLELKPASDGQSVDPGTGREVADFLARQPATCPVIIHSSNSDAAVGMRMVLREAGWESTRVLPFDDTRWIARDWFPAMRRAIVGPIASSASSPQLTSS